MFILVGRESRENSSATEYSSSIFESILSYILKGSDMRTTDW